ncbi:hypothetical protein PRVXT_000822 [Proteinivorax tanatarense]|uniref:Uncharacterized protein n=1 Tax=Proteinivorax tanatarense TaxID=1260629 RepID=A0AAU7VPC0_9FIRM
MKKLFVLMLVFFMLSTQPVSALSSKVNQEKSLIVSGKQNMINYEIYTGEVENYYVLRLAKDNQKGYTPQIKEIIVDLEVNNAKLLSVAPAGKLDVNTSQNKFYSSRGLNSQLKSEGLFLVFKTTSSPNGEVSITFTTTEYTPLSRIEEAKTSDVISFTIN